MGEREGGTARKKRVVRRERARNRGKCGREREREGENQRRGRE